MQILTSVSEIQNNPDFNQGEIPVALTAPFLIFDRVLIGMFGSLLGHACVDVSMSDFEALKRFLYEPQVFRLAVHGIERVWRLHDLGYPETNTHLIIDTEIMAHLLNSGNEKQDYALSHLVQEYLQDDYPLWIQRIADNPHAQVIHEILAWDAYLIYETAYELNEQLHTADSDLAFMYTYEEVPLITILLEMSRNGIAVDSFKAAVLLRNVQNRSDFLYNEITGGEDVNLWRKQEIFDLLVSLLP
jgi:DNA polymerase I-like protein with 3'-5' exonuclease and polymerase domains